MHKFVGTEPVEFPGMNGCFWRPDPILIYTAFSLVILGTSSPPPLALAVHPFQRGLVLIVASVCVYQCVCVFASVCVCVCSLVCRCVFLCYLLITVISLFVDTQNRTMGRYYQGKS